MNGPCWGLRWRVRRSAAAVGASRCRDNLMPTLLSFYSKGFFSFIHDLPEKTVLCKEGSTHVCNMMCEQQARHHGSVSGGRGYQGGLM